MKIGMTVLAFVGCVGELEIGVAVAASYCGVTSAKRKACPRMIEFDFVLNYFPIRRRVAGYAG
jgi:hypothetical protein